MSLQQLGNWNIDCKQGLKKNKNKQDTVEPSEIVAQTKSSGKSIHACI